MKQREHAAQQALASARIEGFEPGNEFLQDLDRLVKGEISHEEMTRIINDRALKNEEKSLAVLVA
jgi:hypothetical protein